MGAFLVMIGIAAASAVCVVAPEPRLAPAPTPHAAVRAACTAEAPAVGASFSGPILQVLDGGVICVAQGPEPSQWVKARFAGAEAISRSDTMAAAFAREVICVVERHEADGVVARCTLDGIALEAVVGPAAVEDASAARP